MVKQIKSLMTIPELLSPVKPLAWPVLYLVLVVVNMGDYLPWEQANFWLGLTGVAGYLRYPLSEKGNYRFLLASLLLLGVYAFLPVKTVYFFALIFALLYGVEAIAGKLHAGVLGLVFLMSPIANYAAEIFSFPIRMELTSRAAALLRATGSAVMAEGNSIRYNGSSFDVDPACMGLNMLVCSMIMGLLSIWLFETKWHRRLSATMVPLVLLVFFVANVAANLMRIITLVFFEVPPQTAMHEVLGICCWILYGIVPGSLMVRHLVKQTGHYEQVKPLKELQLPVLKYYGFSQGILLGLLTLALGTSGLRENYGKKSASPAAIHLAGFAKKELNEGITSFSRRDALIYVKPVRGFYSTDHNPTICWRGSGYKFRKVTEVKMPHAKIYRGELVKGKTRLYTAWWYESGFQRTNSQWLWRKNNLLNGNSYALINVTAATADGLQQAVENWMRERDGALSLQP